MATTPLLQDAPKHNIDVVYMCNGSIVIDVIEDRLQKVDSWLT